MPYLCTVYIFLVAELHVKWFGEIPAFISYSGRIQLHTCITCLFFTCWLTCSRSLVVGGGGAVATSWAESGEREGERAKGEEGGRDRERTNDGRTDERSGLLISAQAYCVRT